MQLFLLEGTSLTQILNPTLKKIYEIHFHLFMTCRYGASHHPL